jgi:plasmid stability protein
MASITVRDVPDEARDELAARAARSGRSLQEYLRAELIALTEKPEVHALMARARDRKARTSTTLAVDQIVHDLDDERR